MPVATGDLTKCLTDGDLPVIRQLSTGELTESDMAAFFSIGFTHHMEIIFKCRSQAERWYYIRKTAMEFWNVEDLKRRIRARDYAVNGKAINNFGLTIPSDRQVSRAVQAFKSEYLLDFVNIVDADDDEETMDELITNSDKSGRLKHYPGLPYVFTEQGIAMLASVLRSATAVSVSVKIMDAFVEMRRTLAALVPITQMLKDLQQKQLLDQGARSPWLRPNRQLVAPRRHGSATVNYIRRLSLTLTRSSPFMKCAAATSGHQFPLVRVPASRASLEFGASLARESLGNGSLR